MFFVATHSFTVYSDNQTTVLFTNRILENCYPSSFPGERNPSVIHYVLPNDGAAERGVQEGQFTPGPQCLRGLTIEDLQYLDCRKCSEMHLKSI